MGSMDLMGRLSELLFVGGYVASGIVFVLLYRLYQTLKSVKRPTTPETTHLTELAIVFQTFRSVIHDQKTLAREFNESLDKRIEFLKQIVKYSAREQQKVYEAQRQLQEHIEGLTREIKTFEQQILEERMRETIEHTASRSLEDAPSTLAPKPSPEEASGPAPLHIVAQPEEASSGGELHDEWVGLDFVGQEPQQYQVPDQPPDSPKDPEAARKAFRALLNMESSEPQASTRPEGGNGKEHPEAGRADLVRSRVYEYHDAGMTVAQIARELGMGKGEVRLMIGLRQKKAN